MAPRFFGLRRLAAHVDCIEGMRFPAFAAETT